MKVIETVAKEFAKHSKPEPRDYVLFPLTFLERLYGEEEPPEYELKHIQLALALINSQPDFDLMAFQWERYCFSLPREQRPDPLPANLPSKVPLSKYFQL